MSENKKVTLVFFMTFAHIVSIIFMSTGIIMMFEELLPYRAFLSGSDYVQMDFTKGVYFMIATMSTIGYGDFAPAHSIVRGWLTVTLLVVVSIVSTDIT
jgi:CBS domain containing-hemolysin-like protein